MSLFGVTTIDIVRASNFLAEVSGDISSAQTITISIFGDYSGVNTLSQATPSLAKNLSQADSEAFTKRIQFGGDEVIKAKNGEGSATLSMAYAGAEFAAKILRAVKGEEVIMESYVSMDACTEGGKKSLEEIGPPPEFFSVSVKLGPNGIEKILPIRELNEYEKGLLKAAIPELQDSISRGVSFISTSKL